MTTIEGVFYLFIFIDCVLVCGNFSILLRRLWNSAIIGGNHFLSTRFAMSSIQMFASIIPRQIIAYLFFRSVRYTVKTEHEYRMSVSDFFGNKRLLVVHSACTGRFRFASYLLCGWISFIQLWLSLFRSVM